MKKILLAIILSATLFGCADHSVSLQEQLDQQIQVIDQLPIASANYRKPFYTYYTEPSIGHYQSSDTYNAFTYQSMRFVMNLNVTAIMNASQQPQQSSTLEPIAIKQGEMMNIQGTLIPYTIEIYQFNRKSVVYMTTSELNFFGIVDTGDASTLAGKMYSIARSVTIRKDAVLRVYSKQPAISYEGEAINLYRDIAPEEGTLQDLIHDKSRIDTSKDRSTSDEN